MSEFDSRVRRVVAEELRDVYRLFQDQAADASVTQPSPLVVQNPNLEPMLREMKEEIRNIERHVSPLGDDQGVQDPKSELKKKILKKLWKKLKELLIDLANPTGKDFPDPEDIAKQLLEGAGVAVDAGEALISWLIPIISTALAAGLQDGAMLHWANTIRADLSARANAAAQARSRLAAQLKKCCENMQSNMTDLSTQMQNEFNTVVDNIIKVGDLVFTVADCCTQLHNRVDIGFKRLESLMSGQVQAQVRLAAADGWQKLYALRGLS